MKNNLTLIRGGHAHSNTSMFTGATVWDTDAGASSSILADGLGKARDKWLNSVCSRLRELDVLSEGWDGYGAPAIENPTISFTAILLYAVWQEALALPMPAITPMSDGSIMVEWRSGTHELTTEVSGPNCVHVFLEDLGSEVVEEFQTTSDFKKVSDALEKCIRLQAVA